MDGGEGWDRMEAIIMADRMETINMAAGASCYHAGRLSIFHPCLSTLRSQICRGCHQARPGTIVVFLPTSHVLTAANAQRCTVSQCISHICKCDISMCLCHLIYGLNLLCLRNGSEVALVDCRIASDGYGWYVRVVGAHRAARVWIRSHHGGCSRSINSLSGTE